MFGGNSNWRGPVWMPMQLMLIRALVDQYAHLGNDFKVECPVGSGRQLNLLEVSEEIARRLSRLFLKDKRGCRPANGDHRQWSDEHWRDHVLFYEYFHGDTGAGIGASHQTGWTGLIAFLIQGFTDVDAEQIMEKGIIAVTEASAEVAREANTTEAVQMAEQAEKATAEKMAAQMLETVQQELTGTLEQAVMEKIVEAVKKAEEATLTETGVDEKKPVL